MFEVFTFTENRSEYIALIDFFIQEYAKLPIMKNGEHYFRHWCGEHRCNRWGCCVLMNAFHGIFFMRIASSEIRFASTHTEFSRFVQKETITERIQRPDLSTPERVTLREATNADRPTMMSEQVQNPNLVDVLDQFESQAAMIQQAVQDVESHRSVLVSLMEVDPEGGVLTESLEMSAEDKARVEMVVAAVEQISGKKIDLVDPEAALEKAYETSDVEELTVVQEAQTALEEPVQVEQPAAVREVHYHFEESYYESESMSFEAEGVVKTADGQEINIDVSLSMSREFMQETSLDVMIEETVKDPLVINFEGSAAELTQRKFEFDLDLDGSSDQISFVSSGSGLLTLDQNGDGTVNDGSELFGARTGNGFNELAAYDDDGNGWIDEGDSVYNGLRIWEKDAEGNDRLMALGKRGVGAIFLGHTSTPFQMKDENNQLHGTVRSSGVFLNESGSVGTVQQLDLVV